MDECEDVPKDFIKLKSEKLSVDEVSELVISPYCGAVSVFIGTTRNNFEGKKVIHLEYEAYTSMAETEIKKICRDVRQKWPSVKHIAVHHRLGVVPITEASVIIAVSSPHRAESLEAVTYCINTLKASVPIWKKAHLWKALPCLYRPAPLPFNTILGSNQRSPELSAFEWQNSVLHRLVEEL
ncbi:molybdopterin synthase catalytic subunit isoform X1 [Grus americana]|uniref:molybdopterin synthase catalytic subunit isoform X1 n=1 Tax=Grus americana TaxID=9117 RepID=UPI002408620B|nr:molybdopterin synthase catalytic subunit isoform X1 [Grus americana]